MKIQKKKWSFSFYEFANRTRFRVNGIAIVVTSVVAGNSPLSLIAIFNAVLINERNNKQGEFPTKSIAKIVIGKNGSKKSFKSVCCSHFLAVMPGCEKNGVMRISLTYRNKFDGTTFPAVAETFEMTCGMV